MKEEIRWRRGGFYTAEAFVIGQAEGGISFFEVVTLMRENDKEPVIRCGRETRKNCGISGGKAEKTFRDKAAGILFAFGCAVILVFLCFGGKNEGADRIYYENSSSAEYDGAVQAMSYGSSGKIEGNKAESAVDKGKVENSKDAENNSANAENGDKKENEPWSLWEFLSRSFEKFFISKGIISDEKSQR